MRSRSGLALLGVLLLLLVLASGCQDKSPIKYSLSIGIQTDEEVVLYLPVPLDEDSGETSGLVKKLQVHEAGDVDASYSVVETKFGKALRIETTGDVKLNSTADYRYYESHPINYSTAMDDNAIYFNFSMIDSYEEDGNALLVYMNSSADGVYLSYDISVSNGPLFETWQTGEESSVDETVRLEEGWQVKPLWHLMGT